MIHWQEKERVHHMYKLVNCKDGLNLHVVLNCVILNKNPSQALGSTWSQWIHTYIPQDDRSLYGYHHYNQWYEQRRQNNWS